MSTIILKDINTFDYKTLQTYCKQYKLKAVGSSSVLKERLETHLKGIKELKKEEVEEEVEDDIVNQLENIKLSNINLIMKYNPSKIKFQKEETKFMFTLANHLFEQLKNSNTFLETYIDQINIDNLLKSKLFDTFSYIVFKRKYEICYAILHLFIKDTKKCKTQHEKIKLLGEYIEYSSSNVE
jgi:hypothetical protein